MGFHKHDTITRTHKSITVMLSTELSSINISKNKQTHKKVFPLLPEERCQLCNDCAFQIVHLRIAHSRFQSPFSLEGNLFIKSYMSAGLGGFGSVLCHHLFQSVFALGYCILIKKPELIMSSENMSNALYHGKNKNSPIPLFMLENCPLKNMQHSQKGIFWN